jgi:fructokinase
LVSGSEYFVFGSLASRNEVSKRTLFQLLEVAKNKVLDINLRMPHFNRRIVEELLSKCDFLKLNIAELELITGWFSNYHSLEDRVKSITEKFKINKLAVTKGGDGASLFLDGREYDHSGFEVEVKDTVGSGDAFLAGLISRLLENSPSKDALEYASALGTFIATKTGACPDYEVKQVDDLINEKKYQNL